jgi:hypothetical protein
MPRALALVIALLFVGGIRAGDKKPLTAERVGQLLTILRSDLNEENRAHAAQELGRADGTQNPEVVFLLIEALKADPKPAVRAEVVDSLAKIRPITREAGQALDAAKEDGSFKVRWHARTAARVYHSAGYGEPEKSVAVSVKGSTNAPRTGSDPSQSQQPAGLLANMFNKPAVNSESKLVSPKQSPLISPKQPVVMPESPKAGGLLANWGSKSKSSAEPIILQQPQQQPLVAPATTQSGGWLYHMMNRSNSTTKPSPSSNEPPLAPSLPNYTPRTTVVPASQHDGSGNPYGDIPSAPATPALQSKLSPYIPQKPVIPQMQGKPGQD